MIVTTLTNKNVTNSKKKIINTPRTQTCQYTISLLLGILVHLIFSYLSSVHCACMRQTYNCGKLSVAEKFLKYVKRSRDKTDVQGIPDQIHHGTVLCVNDVRLYCLKV